MTIAARLTSYVPPRRPRADDTTNTILDRARERSRAVSAYCFAAGTVAPDPSPSSAIATPFTPPEAAPRAPGTPGTPPVRPSAGYRAPTSGRVETVDLTRLPAVPPVRPPSDAPTPTLSDALRPSRTAVRRVG